MHEPRTPCRRRRRRPWRRQVRAWVLVWRETRFVHEHLGNVDRRRDTCGHGGAERPFRMRRVALLASMPWRKAVHPHGNARGVLVDARQDSLGRAMGWMQIPPGESASKMHPNVQVQSKKMPCATSGSPPVPHGWWCRKDIHACEVHLGMGIGNNAIQNEGEVKRMRSDVLQMGRVKRSMPREMEHTLTNNPQSRKGRSPNICQSPSNDRGEAPSTLHCALDRLGHAFARPWLLSLCPKSRIRSFATVCKFEKAIVQSLKIGIHDTRANPSTRTTS